MAHGCMPPAEPSKRLGEVLSEALNQPVGALWEMRNGYALCTGTGLDAIAVHLGKLQPDQVDILRGKLRIRVHSDVTVTDAEGDDGQVVSQDRLIRQTGDPSFGLLCQLLVRSNFCKSWQRPRRSHMPGLECGRVGRS
jgi:hypothetical protein